MKKKTVSLLLVAAMAVGMLAGCGGGKSSISQDGSADAAEGNEKAEMADAVKAVFGEVKTISVPDVEGEFAIITGPLSEAEYEAKAAKLPEIISRIRFKA